MYFLSLNLKLWLGASTWFFLHDIQPRSTIPGVQEFYLNSMQEVKFTTQQAMKDFRWQIHCVPPPAPLT
jgi:hypothetical protein